MTMRSATLSAFCAAALGAPALANGDFNLTYHVERSPAASLGLDDCADIVEREAERSGYRAGTNRFEGKLAVISGGADKAGSFIVQCIAVDDRTVSVVQGIDYRQRKGPLGMFADRVQAAILKAAR